MGYSRAISPVGRAFILGHYQAYGGRKPPPIDTIRILMMRLPGKRPSRGIERLHCWQ